MTPSERNLMQVRLSFLEADLLPEFGENTSLGTIIRSYRARIEEYDKRHK